MRRNAITGAIVWSALFIAAETGAVDLAWIELLFLLAPLVIVPLGLFLTERVEGAWAAPHPEGVAKTIQLPAALMVIVSFFFQPGILAAGFATAWILFGGLLAAGAFVRIVRGAVRKLDLLCPAAAFVYSLIGAAWLVASRLGLNPLGFEEPIVLLTAVHFHFAGFAAALLARSPGRAAADSRASGVMAGLFRVVTAGVLIGPGLLAIGFVAGPRVKLAAALVLSLSELGLAISFVFALKTVARFSAQLHLTIAAASIAFSMALAAVWAIGEYPLQQFVNLDQMERFHGTVNALGFTLCGLIGWILATSKATQQAGQPQ